MDVLTKDVIILEKSKNDSKYHDYHCCNNTRGADTLFGHYENDKKQLLKLLKSNPDTLIQTMWKHHGPLAVDKYCQCSVGRHNIRTPFMCAQCKSIGRLYDYRTGTQTFVIESGSKIGTTFYIVVVPYITHSLKWGPTHIIEIYQYYYQSFHKYPTNIHNLICDSQSANILIQCVVENIMKADHMEHYQTWTSVFVCNNDIHYLYEQSSIDKSEKFVSFDNSAEQTSSQILDELNSSCNEHRRCSLLDNLHECYNQAPVHSDCYDILQPDIIENMIKQMLVIITELRSYHFINDMYVSNMVFSIKPVSYVYHEHHVCGPITLKLARFEKSSIIYNNILIHSKSLYQQPPFVSSIIEISQTNIGAWFRLTRETMIVYEEMRQQGYDLFADAYQWYQYMISLMCDRSCHYAIMNNEQYTELWKMMWSQTDYDYIMKNVAVWHDYSIKPQVSDYKDLLLNVWLCCDIVDRWWKIL